MKKTLLLITILFLAAAIFAQEEATEEPVPQAAAGELAPNAASSDSGFNWNEYPWNLSIGAEYASNTRDSHVAGFGVSLDRYLFCQWLALGLRGMLHNDADTVTATEVTLNLRFYNLEIPYFKNTYFFAQWGFGASFYREEERQINSFLMDVAFGARIYGSGALQRFYIEPYIRTGFPFLFGGGITAGRRFNF